MARVGKILLLVLVLLILAAIGYQAQNLAVIGGIRWWSTRPPT